ncbi:MAG: DUF4215 domain-containing protein [Nannocystis sp.]|nr:DUF4215 domain-containing protein [Nannocystis sp.]MBA3546289.1 DUF4215 domain-containing protein [Nannocystis sp.]
MRTLLLSLSLGLMMSACSGEPNAGTDSTVDSNSATSEAGSTTVEASSGGPTTGTSTTGEPTTGMSTTGEPTSGEPTTGVESTGTLDACGDAQIDPGEECDNGMLNNGMNGSICKIDCQLNSCGDGYLAMNEDCDDANADDTDSCVAGCKTASCGDGFVGPGEGCDDGNQNDDDACSNSCVGASCGDGMVQAGEACDDGNAIETDACLASCAAASCGDKIVQAGVEACDDGNAVDTDACLKNCELAKCGDKVVQAGVEGCDDGNQIDADGCSNACKLPTCSDNAKNGAETDVDCGGANCPDCALGKKCSANNDCTSGLCKVGVCSAVTLTLPPNCAAANVTANQAYMGAVMNSCGCHAGGAGGLTINSAATLKVNTVNIDSSAMMKHVTPSNVDQSYLLYKILNQHLNVPGGNGGSMPQGGMLTDAQKCLLINWVKGGAL